MTKTFEVHTDDRGFYQTTQNFSPPGPFSLSVDIFATLTSPAGININGTVELNTAGGPPQIKQFVASSGQKISLGTWHIPHGNNILIVSGQTLPLSPNTDLTLVVEADLQF
jgi:hypothetical protein